MQKKHIYRTIASRDKKGRSVLVRKLWKKADSIERNSRARPNVVVGQEPAEYTKGRMRRETKREGDRWEEGERGKEWEREEGRGSSRAVKREKER